MTAVFILIGLLACAYFWRVLWFVVGAVAVPALTGVAWCLGALSGLPGRLMRQSRPHRGGAPQMSRSEPSAQVIDLAEKKRTRNRL